MKKMFFILVFKLMMAGVLFAQTDSIDINLSDSIQQELHEVPYNSKLDDKVYDNPDVMPEFPGGTDALWRYISRSIVYPPFAAMNKEQGRVYVYFIVEPDGTIGHAKIARGVSPLLNAEAIRVVKKMPNWSPGIKDSRPVRVSYTVPINFRLQ